MIRTEDKKQVIKSVQQDEANTGTPHAQVAILTARIKELTEHLKANKHDFMARRGLIQMVGKRRRLLKYLERKDFDQYRAVVAQLGLRK